MIIDGVSISATNFQPSTAELKYYVGDTKSKVPNVNSIVATLADDGCVDLKYTIHNTPFERIRRITGR